MSQPLPRRPSQYLLTLPVDEIPVELTATRVHVHLRGPQPSIAFPEVAAEPENGDDEDGEVRLEEVFGRADALSDGGNGRVKLKDGCQRENSGGPWAKNVPERREPER